LLKIGSLILINTNLSYLGGRQGIIIDREDSGRWLVKVAGLLSLDEEESIILSLDESEFTEIDLALEKFLYPRSRYWGSIKPENLVFNANLQEFANRVGFIAALETSGKLSPLEAFEQVQVLWEKLKISKEKLGIDD